MRKFFLLCKVNLLSTLGVARFRDVTSPGKKRNLLLPLLAPIVVVIIAVQLYGLATMFMSASPEGAQAVLGFGVALSAIMTLLLDIYKVPLYIFTPKDFSLLMSMPVGRTTILMSKLTMMYWMNALYSIVVTVPVLVAYGQVCATGVGFWISAIFMALFTPLLPTVICTLVMLLVGKLASLSKMQNAIMFIGTLAFVLFCWGIGFASGMMEEGQMSGQAIFGILDTLYSIYFPARWFAAGVQGDAAMLLAYVAVNIVPYVGLSAILARTYGRINSAMGEQPVKKKAYQRGSLRASSPRMALYKKECRSFFGSYMYVFNSAFGLVLLLLFSIAALVVSGGELLAEFGIGNLAIAPAAAGLIIIMMLVLSNTAAPSISVECGRFALLKAMPIDMRDVLRAKLAVNLTVSLPVLLVAIVCFSIAFSLSVPEAACLVVFTVPAALFTPIIGLIANLWFPRLDYKNELVAIKQGGGVLAAMGLGFGLVAVLFGIGLALMLLTDGLMLPYMLGAGALMLGVDAALYFGYLMRGGAKKLARLDV